jgi:hypothetical protein
LAFIVDGEVAAVLQAALENTGPPATPRAGTLSWARDMKSATSILRPRQGT